MKKLLMIAGTLCVASAIWLLNIPRQAPATPAVSAPAVPTFAQNRNARSPDRDAELSVDGNVVTESFDDGTETVLGIRVRQDRKCKVELKDYVTTDGEMFSAYTCTPFEPAAVHPYADYTNDALEALAYADAEAAARLGRRLAAEDREKAFQLLVRATALDGDPRHLAWLADAYYGRFRVDGRLQLDNVMRQYEIASVAAHFGEDPEASAVLRDTLVGSGLESDEISRLDERVEQLLGRIRNIQVTVFGEVRHGGQGDA
jgi:hypothetical protein